MYGASSTTASAPSPRPARRWQRARGRGLPVVLITNAPRPHAAVAEQLAALGVPREA